MHIINDLNSVITLVAYRALRNCEELLGKQAPKGKKKKTFSRLNDLHEPGVVTITREMEGEISANRLIGRKRSCSPRKRR